MKEQQQIVGTICLEYPRNRRPVLADVSRARFHRAVHADAFFIRPMPLPPAVALRSLHRDAVMIAGNIGESL